MLEMCARPRKASDEDVFAAVARVMGRLGPSELTLAEIAEEAGLTAGALVQRFGSKRQLLVTLAQGVASSTDQMIAGLRATHASPLETLHAYADCFAEMAESPAALARNLAYLQNDLTDPLLRAPLLQQSRATRSGFERLLTEAVETAELLRDTDVPSLARTIELTLGGSLMSWGIYQEGTAADWLREDLAAVLRPHLASPAAAPHGPGTRRATSAPPRRSISNKRSKRTS